jgi:hypothetical protein
MEKLLAHIGAYAYIYGAAAVLFIAVVFIMNITTYETHIIRNYIKSIFFPRRESFQNQDVIAGGEKIADTVSWEHCQKLKEQLDVYEKLKITHKGVPIENLDETITAMKDYFVLYNCE